MEGWPSSSSSTHGGAGWGGDRRTDAFKEQVTGSSREGRETDRRFLGWAADRVMVSDR